MADEEIETPEAPETEPTGEEVEPEAPASDDPFESGADSFDRAYVEKLRGENASLRTKAKAFDGWEDEEALEAWSTLVSKAKEDPGGALADLVLDGYGMSREQLLEFADAIYQGEEPQIPEGMGEGDDPDLDRPLTMRELQAREMERENQELTRRAIEGVRSEARDLGFNPDAKVGSKALHQYRTLVSLAQEAYAGDLKKAAAAINEWRAEDWREVDERKRKEAETSPTVPDGGAGTEPADRPTGWGASRRSALERAAANGRPLPTP